MYSIKRYNGTDARITTMPNICPYCNYTISPIPIAGFDSHDRNTFIGLLKCSNTSCGLGFTAHFRKVRDNNFEFSDIPTYTIKKRDWGSNICKVSPSFVEIFNQAYHAEQYKLKEICGVGYRKAIEFLIKDYLISIYPEQKDKVLNLFLGKCISDYITNDKIKEISKRAVWLGNDETHYCRKWEDRELSDLVKLIEITVHWIEMELLTKDYITGMPESV